MEIGSNFRPCLQSDYEPIDCPLSAIHLINEALDYIPEKALLKPTWIHLDVNVTEEAAQQALFYYRSLGLSFVTCEHLKDHNIPQLRRFVFYRGFDFLHYLPMFPWPTHHAYVMRHCYSIPPNK